MIDFNVSAIPLDIIAAIQQVADVTYQQQMQSQLQPNNQPVQMQEAGK